MPNVEELQALQDFYYATGGDLWATRSGWPSSDWEWQTATVGQAADWVGVQVADGDVVSLVSSSNGLRGQLPASLGQLTQLRVLRLGGAPNLKGPLPTSIGQLTQLQTLHIYNTGLGNSLPAQLGQLTQLRSLLLAKNQFAGSIPTELGQLSNLTYLNLSDTYQDLYPEATIIGVLGSLEGEGTPGNPTFNESNNGNRFSGAIPTSLGQLTQLVTLRLSLHGGATRGPLPAGLSSLSQLSTLSLTNCRLTGPVPAWLVQLPQLQTLQLEENELTSLPDFRQAPNRSSLGLMVGGNHFDFADLERNTNAPPDKASFRSFTFAGQRPRPGTDTAYAVRGGSRVLSRRMGGSFNHYQWERRVGNEWITLAGKTGPELTVTSMNEAAEGHYRTRVTHDWFEGTVLYTRPVYLSQLPYAQLPLNEPDASTPMAGTPPPAPLNRPVGQTDPVNYVRTYTARTAYTDPADLRNAFVSGPPENVAVSTQYLDGLGRPVQIVQHAASPTGRDLVQRTEYDALGREPRQYLPYTAAPTAADAAKYHPNAKAAQYQFYQGQGQDPLLPQLTATLPKTAVAYAETVFEASPLNRPRAQAAAGESWQLGGGHETTLDERASVATDSVQRWEPGYGSERENLSPRGAYAAGELWVSTSRDEQGQWRQSFTDKEGRVVLSQVGLNGSYQQPATQWLKTYYVFDDFGRLRAVLPPLAVQRLRQNNWQLPGAGVERLLFRYHYDARGRLTEKQVPDQAGYAYTLYNALDQPILTQTVSQQARKEWVGTSYDALGRVIYTGLVRFTALTGTPSQQYTQLLGWQANWLAGNASIPLWEEPSATATMGRAYYSARSWPALGPSGAELLSVAYYDHYDFNQDGQPDVAYQPPTATQLGGPVPAVDLRVTGQATGSWVRVLGRAATAADAWLSSTTFYDEKLRPIQVQATNARGGTDVSTSRYDFAGQMLSAYTTHQVPNQPQQRVVREQRAYDAAGRLLTVTQELDGAPAQVLARHTYNELGQLAKKELGGKWATGTPIPRPGQPGPRALQTVDYRYNIRGWLTGINDIEQTQPAGPLDPFADLWSFALSYETGFQDPQYNGNIAGQRWRAASDGVERAYGYRYDQLNRLLQGDFVARPTPAAGWGAERGNYRFSSASYDAGGNLLTLRRRGLVAAASRTVAAQYAETDNLRYRYASPNAEPASNRLHRVDDLAPAATAFGAKPPARPDFSDGPTGGSQQPDYTYDVAGSLTSDLNKGIRLIRYNHLQLPERLEWANGNVLEYTYSAAGQKVSKLATEAGKPAVRTDYLGPWQYERDSLRWLTHAEGRALYTYKKDLAGQPLTKVNYEYTLKDHLGNLRVAFHPGERTSYYAGLDSNPEQTRREQRAFDSVSVSYPIRRVVGMQFARSGDGVALLNAAGAMPQPLGPLKQLSVAKGDTVDVVAYGMYQQPARTGWGFSLAGFVAGLLQPAVGVPAPPDGGRRVRVLPLLSVGLGLVPAVQQLAGGVPKAYVRVLVYTADSVLVAWPTKQLTSAALNGYEQLSLRVFVPAAGYVQAYVANESDTDVFFDDISVEHRQGLQVQENQYDPFGLELVGLSKSATPENKFTFNGKEKQDEFGLGWHDYGARMYDPAIIRWNTGDPLASKMPEWSPYVMSYDNPISFLDPDGARPFPANDPTFASRITAMIGSTFANVVQYSNNFSMRALEQWGHGGINYRAGMFTVQGLIGEAIVSNKVQTSVVNTYRQIGRASVLSPQSIPETYASTQVRNGVNEGGNEIDVVARITGGSIGKVEMQFNNSDGSANNTSYNLGKGESVNFAMEVKTIGSHRNTSKILARGMSQAVRNATGYGNENDGKTVPVLVTDMNAWETAMGDKGFAEKYNSFSANGGKLVLIDGLTKEARAKTKEVYEEARK
ncbi:hypothetical protein J7E24_06340 [Hymenobacter sp. ISL-91]|uniref:DUF6443 domain-containing protein n=1 Tax=Hymenobacter sp. ISL-91 TaxID=2819151 RepID=UPI001BE66D76|nr:DUF6443 domain-containing protein [Hymenobacter sp. ISL-91]MBT2557397.1 hypothetical protein [Hymenobacter sp. ISL-91]